MRASVVVAGAAIWTALVSFAAFSFGETKARARYEEEKAKRADVVAENTIKQAEKAEIIKKEVKNAVIQNKDECAAILSYDLSKCLRRPDGVSLLSDRIRKD